MSRDCVQASASGNGIGPITPRLRPSTRPARAPRTAALQRLSLLITQDAAFMIALSALGSRCSARWVSTCAFRRCTSIEGMSIFTGQAS